MNGNNQKTVNPFEIEKQDNDGWDDWDDDVDDMEDVSDVPLTSAGGYQAASNGRGGYQPPGRGPVPPPPYQAPPYGNYAMAMLVVVGILVWLSSGGSSDVSDDMSDDSTTSHLNIHDSSSKDDSAWQLVLLGERYSGLPWLEQSLRICFPAATVTTKLYREGTFFQQDPHISTPKVVLPIFTNVYDWVSAMQENPTYAPDHANKAWDAFVTTPWSPKVAGTPTNNQIPSGSSCQHRFASDQVIPCVARDDGAVYELDVHGAPFANILDLRAAKITNFVQDTATYEGVMGVIPVQYESLVVPGTGGVTPGLMEVLKRVNSISGQNWVCDVENLLAPAMGTDDAVNADLKYWLTEHVNWQVESLVGYQPWISPNSADPKSINNDEATKDDDLNPLATMQPTNAISAFPKDDQVAIPSTQVAVTIPPQQDKGTIPPKQEVVTIPPKQDKVTIPPKQDKVTIPPKESGANDSLVKKVTISPKATDLSEKDTPKGTTSTQGDDDGDDDTPTNIIPSKVTEEKSIETKTGPGNFPEDEDDVKESDDDDEEKETPKGTTSTQGDDDDGDDDTPTNIIPSKVTEEKSIETKTGPGNIPEDEDDEKESDDDDEKEDDVEESDDDDEEEDDDNESDDDEKEEDENKESDDDKGNEESTDSSTSKASKIHDNAKEEAADEDDDDETTDGASKATKPKIDDDDTVDENLDSGEDEEDDDKEPSASAAKGTTSNEAVDGLSESESTTVKETAPAVKREGDTSTDKGAKSSKPMSKADAPSSAPKETESEDDDAAAAAKIKSKETVSKQAFGTASPKEKPLATEVDDDVLTEVGSKEKAITQVKEDSSSGKLPSALTQKPLDEADGGDDDDDTVNNETTDGDDDNDNETLIAAAKATPTKVKEEDAGATAAAKIASPENQMLSPSEDDDATDEAIVSGTSKVSGAKVVQVDSTAKGSTSETVPEMEDDDDTANIVTIEPQSMSPKEVEDDDDSTDLEAVSSKDTMSTEEDYNDANDSPTVSGTSKNTAPKKKSKETTPVMVDDDKADTVTSTGTTTHVPPTVAVEGDYKDNKETTSDETDDDDTKSLRTNPGSAINNVPTKVPSADVIGKKVSTGKEAAPKTADKEKTTHIAKLPAIPEGISANANKTDVSGEPPVISTATKDGSLASIDTPIKPEPKTKAKTKKHPINLEEGGLETAAPIKTAAQSMDTPIESEPKTKVKTKKHPMNSEEGGLETAAPIKTAAQSEMKETTDTAVEDNAETSAFEKKKKKKKKKHPNRF